MQQSRCSGPGAAVPGQRSRGSGPGAAVPGQRSRGSGPGAAVPVHTIPAGLNHGNGGSEVPQSLIILSGDTHLLPNSVVIYLPDFVLMETIDCRRFCF